MKIRTVLEGNSRALLVPAVIITLLLSACGSDPTPTATAAPAPTATTAPAPAATTPAGSTPDAPSGPTATPTPDAQAAFEAEWAELVAKAQEEGEVVVLASSANVSNNRPVFEEFTKQFGVTLIAAPGSGSDHVNRLLAERSAGRYTADVAQVGGGSQGRLGDAEIIVPIWPLIIRPDIIEPDGWWIPQPIFTDLFGKYSLGINRSAGLNVQDIYYNTNNVSQEELDTIQSWQDFLDPKWKGRIVSHLDPTVGSGQGDRTSMWLKLGEPWFDTFVREMDVNLVPGSAGRIQTEGIARGKYDIMFFSGSGGGSGTRAIIELGLPVALLERTLAEGVSVEITGNNSIIERAAHPNAAQLFYNWWYSKDGQTALTTLTKNTAPSPSLRTDVPQGKVPDDLWALAQSVQPDEIVRADDPIYRQAQLDVNAWLAEIHAELGNYGN